ncbi:hypothetical protein LXL04_007970 [Taraxacum kok-saghyz]
MQSTQGFRLNLPIIHADHPSIRQPFHTDRPLVRLTIPLRCIKNSYPGFQPQPRSSPFLLHACTLALISVDIARMLQMARRLLRFPSLYIPRFEIRLEREKSELKGTFGATTTAPRFIAIEAVSDSSDELEPFVLAPAPPAETITVSHTGNQRSGISFLAPVYHLHHTNDSERQFRDAAVVDDGEVVWEQRLKDVEAERDRKAVNSPGFSFSAAGILFPYHLGVAKFLIEKGYIKVLHRPLFISVISTTKKRSIQVLSFHLRIRVTELQHNLNQDTTPLAGSSAGSIVCAVVASGASMEEALQATKILAQDCRSRGTAFRLGAVLREVLESFLPENAHIRSDGRLNRFSAILMILQNKLTKLQHRVPYVGGSMRRCSIRTDPGGITVTSGSTFFLSRFQQKKMQQFSCFWGLLKCRWFTYLNSDFNKGGWSHEEDMLLCEPQKISAMHKYFAGKSAWVFEFLEFCFAKAVWKGKEDWKDKDFDELGHIGKFRTKIVKNFFYRVHLCKLLWREQICIMVSIIRVDRVMGFGTEIKKFKKLVYWLIGSYSVWGHFGQFSIDSVYRRARKIKKKLLGQGQFWKNRSHEALTTVKHLASNSKGSRRYESRKTAYKQWDYRHLSSRTELAVIPKPELQTTNHRMLRNNHTWDYVSRL